MGYVQAQDRMWQLEVQRRIAQGRLSEIFGARTLGQDAWMRTLGLHQAARAAWPRLSAEAQLSLQAYAAGINAWLATKPTLSPEFALLGITPQPWTPVDSLAWIKVFALNLSGNSNEEILRYLSAGSLTAEEQATFFQDKSKDTDLARGSQADRQAMSALLGIQSEMQSALKIGGRFVGSNAWAVSKRWTGSGGAMLANDPHMGMQMPSLWYPVVQHGQRLRSSGMSLVGLPLVIFGRNHDIAWAGTNLPADVQDLYVERTDERNGGQYWSGGRWERFGERLETIVVKPDFPAALRNAVKPVQLRLRSTCHGPVISDAVSAVGQPMALRWTALDAADTTYESFYRLNLATDWASFRAALSYHVAPALNIVYADSAGHIGYQSIGRIPVRGKGDGGHPVDGADGQFAWQGYIPFDDMPRSYDPPSGFIVSANQRMVDSDYPYFLSGDWASPVRAERIAAMLEAAKRRGGIGVAEFQKIQLDTVNVPALRIKTLLETQPATTARQREALRYLKAWNGQMAEDSQGAAIFTAWTRQLRQKLFVEQLKVGWERRQRAPYLNALLERVTVDELGLLFNDRGNIWCGERRRPGRPDCPTVLTESLDAGLDELERLGGSSMADWRWGDLHQTVLAHTPFSEQKMLDSVFERRFASGGGPDVVNVANAEFRPAEGYVQNFGAGFRQIIDLGQGARAAHVYINSTGQSGNVLSTHYADMTAAYAQGRYFSLLPAATATPGQR
jgi:penicillin amidase